MSLLMHLRSHPNSLKYRAPHVWLLCEENEFKVTEGKCNKWNTFQICPINYWLY